MHTLKVLSTLFVASTAFPAHQEEKATRGKKVQSRKADVLEKFQLALFVASFALFEQQNDDAFSQQENLLLTSNRGTHREGKHEGPHENPFFSARKTQVEGCCCLFVAALHLLRKISINTTMRSQRKKKYSRLAKCYVGRTSTTQE